MPLGALTPGVGNTGDRVVLRPGMPVSGIPSTGYADTVTSEDDMEGNGPNLLIVFYVQIMPDDFIMQLHRF